MSCPFFDPVTAREAGGHSAMLPLGDWWVGVCRADPGNPHPAGENELRMACNIGYARAKCGCFPAAEGPDAVRFTIARDNGSTVEIRWVVERGHFPDAHGTLEYGPGAEARGQCPEMVDRQARAYLQSYFRRKGDSAGR